MVGSGSSKLDLSDDFSEALFDRVLSIGKVLNLSFSRCLVSSDFSVIGFMLSVFALVVGIILTYESLNGGLSVVVDVCLEIGEEAIQLDW